MDAVLDLEGFQAITLPTASAALEYFRDHTVALAIIDYRLPDFDGVALTETLRAAPSTRQTPVILMTALDPRGIAPIQEAARRLDAVVLLKPFELETASATIRRMVNSRAPLRRTRRA